MSASPRKVTELLRRREMTRWVMCGRLRVGKDYFTLQRWSVQPCVRPVSAVHVTDGADLFHRKLAATLVKAADSKRCRGLNEISAISMDRLRDWAAMENKDPFVGKIRH
jgi:hypothetical protein